MPRRPSPRQRGCRLRSAGVIPPDGLQIYMPKPLLEEIVDYAGRERERVRGGFILGYPGDSGGERFVEGRAHVPAEKGLGDRTNVRFTKSCFLDLTAQREHLWPDTSVVGWYSTRLDSGIYLSTTDLETHRGSFNLPFQFALVVDPARGHLGFFSWRGSAVEATGFHLFEPQTG